MPLLSNEMRRRLQEERLECWARTDISPPVRSILGAVLDALLELDDPPPPMALSPSLRDEVPNRFIALVPWRDILLGLTAEGEIYNLTFEDHRLLPAQLLFQGGALPQGTR